MKKDKLHSAAKKQESKFLFPTPKMETNWEVIQHKVCSQLVNHSGKQATSS